VFLKLTADQVLVFDWIAGSCQVNLLAVLFGSQLTLTQDYKSEPKYNFSCIQMFFTAFVLCILTTLRLFKLKTEGQTKETENLTVKLQNQNFRISWVSLIGL